jgi:hydroxyacylglutathione hydrolase
MFNSRENYSAKIGKEIIKNIFYFGEYLSLDCNQYIISDDINGELALFDGGNGVSLKGLIEGMKKFHLNFENISKVFLTHEHVDHVLGLYPLMEILQDNPPKIYAYTETAKILKEGKQSKIFPGNLGISPSMFGITIVPLKVLELHDGEHFQLGSDFVFYVYFTPGHSQGSICFYEPNKKILIAGDLVFAGGSFGRFDFPGGSLKLLTESIKFVSTLDVEFLLPGHMDISSKGTLEIQNSYRMVQSIGRFL